MGHKILAVQNCGPSGSTLVQSLLDNHPDIISLPALHALELVIFWESHCGLSRDEFFEKFIQHFKFYYTPDLVPNGLGLRELGENQNELACVDEATFISKFKQYLEADAFGFKNYLIAVFRSYHESLGNTYNENAYLLYPIHSLNQRFAKIIIDHFDSVKFLYTIREPIQAIGSAAKHINKDRAWDHLPLLTCISAQMICDYTIHVGPHDVYGMRPYFSNKHSPHVESKAIRLEDVHRSTRETFGKVAQWLEIPWHDNFLLSTFNGKIWHNRPESIRQSGVGSATLKQKHTDILTRFDKFRFALLTKRFSSHYQYKKSYSLNIITQIVISLLLLFPFQMERLSDRKQRQIAQFQAKKNNRRLTRYIPNQLDGLLISGKNIVEGLKCRYRWMLPALFNKSEAMKADYVELL